MTDKPNCPLRRPASETDRPGREAGSEAWDANLPRLHCILSQEPLEGSALLWASCVTHLSRHHVSSRHLQRRQVIISSSHVLLSHEERRISKTCAPHTPAN